MNRLNFSWVVPNTLAGLARPQFKEDIVFLRNEGITVLVSLTESKPDIHGVTGITHLHLPIHDFTSPSFEQVRKFLDTVKEVENTNLAVAVHCAHGMGRAGTMLACYIVESTGCSGDDAISKIRELRPGSVETIEQEEFIRKFASGSLAT